MSIIYQKMKVLLAELHVLPKLVNGKVAIINDNNTYTLATVPRTVTIEDDFSPENYCLLNEGKWHNLIVYSSTVDKENWLVNKQLRNLSIKPCRVGDKIHIHSRQGIYSVVEVKQNSLVITCKKWQYESDPNHEIIISDFKCLAGGLNNHNF